MAVRYRVTAVAMGWLNGSEGSIPANRRGRTERRLTL